MYFLIDVADVADVAMEAGHNAELVANEQNSDFEHKKYVNKRKNGRIWGIIAVKSPTNSRNGIDIYV